MTSLVDAKTWVTEHIGTLTVDDLKTLVSQLSTDLPTGSIYIFFSGLVGGIQSGDLSETIKNGLGGGVGDFRDTDAGKFMWSSQS